jgi:hypothetical protein
LADLYEVFATGYILAIAALHVTSPHGLAVSAANRFALTLD